jgi:hypothetical protein
MYIQTGNLLPMYIDRKMKKTMRLILHNFKKIKNNETNIA